MGGFKTVSLSSVKLMEEVLRKEEKFPSRGDMALWTDYRDMRGLGYGPFTELRAPQTSIITSAKEVMFSPEFVCLYVC